MKIKLMIFGEPIGKQRPRVFYHKQAKRFIAMTPSKTSSFENLIKETFMLFYPNFKPIQEAIILKINAYFSIPKSISKKKRDLMIEGKLRPIRRPDVDNCLKICMDALEKVAFLNDSQIIEARIKKFYSEVPRLEITIKKLEENFKENGGLK